MSPAAITVTGVGKRFPHPGSDRPTTLKEAVLKGFSGLKTEWFWGLRDVSFSIPKGRVVGLIGRNGTGKSTLLRLIGGVGRPDEGAVQTHGRIGALLDLGAGMTSDLTGRENAMISGVIAGMTTAEVKARFDEIVAFAELEDFIDAPIRTYSTGMRMRLAFAVAAHTAPDILLIDEVLAVGDVAFQKKCVERIAEFKAAGCTIVLVSHDAEQIRTLCDEVVLLRQGRLVAVGPTHKILGQYEESTGARSFDPDPELVSTIALPDGNVLEYNFNRFGSQEAQIRNVRLLDFSGRQTDSIASGDGLAIEFEYEAIGDVLSPRACVSICQEDSSIAFDTNTSVGGLDLPHDRRTGKLRLVIDRVDLVEGQYFLTLSLFEQNWAYAYDQHAMVYPLSITGAAGSGLGLLNPPAHWGLLPA